MADHPEIPQAVRDAKIIVPLPRALFSDAIGAIEVLVQSGYRCLSVPAGAETLADEIATVYGRRATLCTHAVATVAHAEFAACRGFALAIVEGADPDVLPALDGSQTPYLVAGLTPNEVVRSWESSACAGVQVLPVSAMSGEYPQALRVLAPTVRLVAGWPVTGEQARGWLIAGAQAIVAGPDLVGDACTGGSLPQLRSRASDFAVEVGLK